MTTPTQPHDDGETLKGLGDCGHCVFCGDYPPSGLMRSYGVDRCSGCDARVYPNGPRWEHEYARRVSNMLATAPKPELPISIVALAQRLDSEQISDRQRFGLEERAALHTFLRAAQNYYRLNEATAPKSRGGEETAKANCKKCGSALIGFDWCVNGCHLGAMTASPEEAALRERIASLESELARLKAPARGGEEPRTLWYLREIAKSSDPEVPALHVTPMQARDVVTFIDSAQSERSGLERARSTLAGFIGLVSTAVDNPRDEAEVDGMRKCLRALDAAIAAASSELPS